MQWGNMWQYDTQLLYEVNRRALGTRDMVTLFFQFVSSPIVWFLAVKQNLSEPKLNLLLLWSCSRRILKEGRVKWLLPQSRSGRGQFIEDGNSPLFNNQLLIKRTDNVPRKVTKYPANWTHSFIVGMISIYSKENTHTFSLHYPVLLLCPFVLYCVQNKDNHG